MFVFKTVVLGTVLLFAVLFVGPWLALQFAESFPRIDVWFLKYIGGALFGMGLLIAVYCAAVLFIPGKSRPAPYDAGGTFIIEGPYRYMRNPFMLGVVLALWGEALFISTLVIIIYALFFTWIIHFWVVFFEEPALEERFGDEYSSYKRAVPRWLPQFSRYEF